MSVIRWEDPPDSMSYDWPCIAADLKMRPGVWAIVAVPRNAGLAGQMAKHIRQSAYEAMHGAQFEATARTVEAEHRVYARYVGPS